MARFIINDKIYDTETAEKLCEYDAQWKMETLLGSWYPFRDTTLYRTKKRAYFRVSNADYGRLQAELLTEEDAKQVLMRQNYEKYCELYKPLEEG